MKTDVQYFNSIEAAKVLGVNVSTIKRWTDEGKLKCIKSAGGHRKFLISHLADFLENHKEKMSKASLFPAESKTDLKVSYYIMKGDFEFLKEHVRKQALLGKRDLVQNTLNGLYLGQYPLYEIYDRLLTPVLHQIGEMWYQGKLSIVEEHIASQTIRDTITRLQGIIRIPAKKTGKAFCLNLSYELHDIALKMTDHILEARGYKTFYSGQTTPILKLEHLFEKVRPQRVYISSTLIKDTAVFEEEFRNVCDIGEQFEAQVFIGGQGFDHVSIDHSAIKQRLYTFEEVHRI